MNTKIAEQLAGLSPTEQRALLDRLLRERTQAKKAPLSFAQERLWFLYQLEPASAAYNLRTAVRLSGNLHIPALEQGLDEVVQRHEALRTRFIVEQERPLQLIAPSLKLPLPVVDVIESDVDRLADEEAQQPFSLSSGPLIRAKLLRLSATEHVLLVTMHHIISDGWSIGLFIRELTTLYEEKIAPKGVTLPALPIQYAEFATWQREWLQGETLDKQLTYWQQKLGGNLSVLEFPTDYPRPPRQTDAGTRLPFRADTTVTQALHKLCQAEGVTTFMLLLAAFNVLLYRYTQQTDLLVGTPIAGRTRRQVEGLIGLFINTLVMRADLSGNPTFRELLKRVEITAKEAYDHQDIPFERLVEVLQPVRDPSRSPLFQVMLVLQNAPMATLELTDLHLTQLRPNKGTSQFDMTMMMWDDDDVLTGYLEYRTDLFTTSTMQQFLVHLGELLHSIAEDPDQPIGHLPMLPAAEQKQMVVQWNNTAVPYEDKLCIHHFISGQAQRTPDHVALDFGDQQVTYREMETRANQIAQALIQVGVQPETIVALCMERSVEMIIAILGILKAGGAYVPIDPTYPSQRIQYILGDSQAPLLVSQSYLLSKIPSHQVQMLCLDEIDTANFSTQDPQVALYPDNLAYIIYTSGSTGHPKGVLVPHRGLLNVIKAHHDVFHLTPQDKVLQFASFSFDASVHDMLLALASGGTLQLATQQEILPGPDLLKLLQEKGVTMTTLMPSALAALPEAELPALRILAVAGEPCANTLVDRWGQNRQFFNLYGPTEASIWVTYAHCTTGKNTPPPIGTPVGNMQTYVLDTYLQPVPIGVTGELYLGGAGITRGYHNRAGLTATRFVPNPFSQQPGARLYKTGDMARYRPDGQLEFVGRIDNQVKIRGYRIELGEIVHVLGGHEAVQEAAIIMRTDPHQQQRLVAYVITAKAITTTELRQYLKTRLPDYMIPSSFIFMEAFPQTPNHKLDVRALPAPEQVTGQTNYIPPRNKTEKRLAQIWRTLLGVKRIGIHENFFDSGGHSLLVTQLASRLQQEFGIEIPLRDLFDLTTIAAQSGRIIELQHQDRKQRIPTIQPTPRPLHLPLSYGQQRLWILNQLNPNISTYHIPAALRINGLLNENALQKALDAIVARHEVLRTNFLVQDGTPIQHLVPFRSVSLSRINLIGQPQAEMQVMPLLRQEAYHPFNLTQDPLLRAYLVQLATDDYILLLVMHHIVSDGWSMGILIRELTALYEAFSQDKPDPLPPLPLQYADFVLWQQNWLQGDILQTQLDYWREQLANAPTVINLPMAQPRPAIQTFNGAQHIFDIPNHLARAIRNESQQQGVTLFMTLLAVFQVLLHRYSNQNDILVGAPVANRHFMEIENLIGFFVNTLVFRARFHGAITFTDLVQQVRETVLAAQTHQDLPFEKLVEELSPQRNLSHAPMFQVMFVLQSDMDTGVPTLPNLHIDPLPLPGNTAKFDLMLVITEQKGTLRGSLEYNTDLFNEPVIHNMVGHFLTLLEGIINNPRERVAHLPLLTDREKRQLLRTQNEQYAAPYPRTITLHERFHQEARQNPSALAVVHAETQLTYSELDERANRLAHYLQALGVKRGTLVGISTTASVDRVVAVLAVLKAGGAYVPLDPTYPHERLAFMLADTQTPVLLTQATLLSQLPPHAATDICLDQVDLSPYSPDTPDIPVDPADLAYVTYTSGSTGRPKGVCSAHAGVLNLLANFDQWQPLQTGQNSSWWTSFNFDVSVYEMFAPLISGATLHITPHSVRLDTRMFARWMVDNEIHSAYIPPFMLAPLLALWQTGEFVPPLKRLLVGVEPIPEHILAEMRQVISGLVIINGYGPSEATVCITLYPVPLHPAHAGNTPIGHPVQNLEIYLLDEQMQPVPMGIPGELYVGGIGLAHGYLHRPSLTATRFVPNPFSSELGERLYRTGDMVRYLPEGNMMFIGRQDHQVKIRGYRVELEEIKQVLEKHEGVRETAVLVRTDTSSQQRLIAYVIPHLGFGVTANELQTYLKQRLPDYMVPEAIVLLDSFPQTPNGKLDRNALPAPVAQRLVAIEYEPPQTAIQQKIAAIMQDVLKIERVGIHDNFFDLGAHSYLLIQAHAHLQSEFQRDIAVVDLFRYATVESLATYLNQDEHEQQATVTAIQQREQKRRAALQQAKRRTKQR